MVGNCAVFYFSSACENGGLGIGSIAELGTLVIAVLALIAAVWAGISANRQAQAATAALRADVTEREQAQARLVYSTRTSKQWIAPNDLVIPSDDRTVVFEPGYVGRHASDVSGHTAAYAKRWGNQLHVTVHNGSEEIIGAVAVQARNPYLKRCSGQGVYVRPVPPHDKLECTLVLAMSADFEPKDTSPEDQASGWEVTIEYRDSSGVWWSRTGSRYIEKIDRGPDELP